MMQKMNGLFFDDLPLQMESLKVTGHSIKKIVGFPPSVQDFFGL